MKRIIMLLIIQLLIAFPIFAADVKVGENQAKLEINGAVCAYCAYGVQKSLSKMSCVDKSQGRKGVEADIDNQIITIYLKEGKQLDLKDAYNSIKKGGYEPRTFHLRVQGFAVKEGSQTFLKNAANERIFELVGNQVDQLEQQNTYELQLLVDESVLKSFNKKKVPLAQIQTIFKRE